MRNNMFETTSLVAVKNFPHCVLKSSIPLSNSTLQLYSQTPNKNVPQRILIFGSRNKTVAMAGEG